MSCEIIVTMPMPIMDSGSRPTNPAAEKPLLPGAEKMARYGLGKAGSGQAERKA
ncbi:hypothetical protein GCM10010295_17940 [Streptomyces intermedius]